MRHCAFALVLVWAAPLGGQSFKAMEAPALPFEDWKACPFEGCVYRDWTARSEVPVYDTWKDGRKAVAEIRKGETVKGLTGLVLTRRPGVVRMDRDYAEAGLKRGEQILTYAYRGEGYSAVWFRGRYYKEFDISFTKWPDGQGCGGAHCAATYLDLGDKTWWAQVRRRSGITGWVDMSHADFDGTDMLAAIREGRLAAAKAGDIDGGGVARFVEHHFQFAGQDHHGGDAVAFGFGFAFEADAFGAEFSDGGADIVTHEGELVAHTGIKGGAFGRMHT